jgi:hypothetical protein
VNETRGVNGLVDELRRWASNSNKEKEADAGHQELQHAKSRSCWLQQRNVGQLAASDPVLLLSGS